MAGETTGSRVTRRAVLSLAAAVSAVAVPGALGTSAAHAARRPPLEGVPPVSIHTQAALFTGQPGPVPNGIRLVLDLADPKGPGTIEFDKLFVPNLGELTTFNPTLLGVGGRRTVILDVGPVLQGQLPPRFQLILVYSYFYDGGSDLEVQATQQVTLVPLQALGAKPLKPAKPPKPKPKPKPH